MIKVGDKVLVVGDSTYCGKQFVGQTCEVVRIDSNKVYSMYYLKGDHEREGRIQLWFPASSVQEIKDGGWLYNKTGVCPFEDHDTRIDVKYRDGYTLEDVPAQAEFVGRDTSVYYWKIDGMQADIVEYRLHNAVQAMPEPVSTVAVSGLVADLEERNKALVAENEQLKATIAAIKELL